MRCADSSFLIDLLQGRPEAVRKAADLSEGEGRLAVPAPCVAEMLRGAHRAGRGDLRRTFALLRQLDVIPIDREVAQMAGELSAECDRRGRSVSMVDCLVAAAAKSAGAVLITRDADFARIPGLSVETY